MLRHPHYLEIPWEVHWHEEPHRMMFLAPEVWAGVVLLALGVAIELAGISLERRNGR